MMADGGGLIGEYRKWGENGGAVFYVGHGTRRTLPPVPGTTRYRRRFLLHFIDAGRIGNCCVLYFKAGYCFVFVNYNGKLRRMKRIFSYITEKYGELS